MNDKNDPKVPEKPWVHRTSRGKRASRGRPLSVFRNLSKKAQALLYISAAIATILALIIAGIAAWDASPTFRRLLQPFIGGATPSPGGAMPSQASPSPEAPPTISLTSPNKQPTCRSATRIYSFSTTGIKGVPLQIKEHGHVDQPIKIRTSYLTELKVRIGRESIGDVAPAAADNIGAAHMELWKGKKMVHGEKASALNNVDTVFTLSSPLPVPKDATYVLKIFNDQPGAVFGIYATQEMDQSLEKIAVFGQVDTLQRVIRPHNEPRQLAAVVIGCN